MPAQMHVHAANVAHSPAWAPQGLLVLMPALFIPLPRRETAATRHEDIDVRRRCASERSASQVHKVDRFDWAAKKAAPQCAKLRH